MGAGVAQLVERNLAKVEVASSRLVSRSKFKYSNSKSYVFTLLTLVPKKTTNFSGTFPIRTLYRMRSVSFIILRYIMIFNFYAVLVILRKWLLHSRCSLDWLPGNTNLFLILGKILIYGIPSFLRSIARIIHISFFTST